MKTIKLAEALLRRKELQGKVDILRQLKDQVIYETRVKRVPAAEGIDDVTATVCKLDAGQVTHEYDWHARQLRLVDAAIQQANWTTGIGVEDSVTNDYIKPKE